MGPCCMVFGAGLKVQLHPHLQVAPRHVLIAISNVLCPSTHHSLPSPAHSHLLNALPLPACLQHALRCLLWQHRRRRHGTSRCCRTAFICAAGYTHPWQGEQRAPPRRPSDCRVSGSRAPFACCFPFVAGTPLWLAQRAESSPAAELMLPFRYLHLAAHPLPCPPACSPCRSTTRTPDPRPMGGSDIVVSATVTQQQFPLASVSLMYTVGYGAPETAIPMTGPASCCMPWAAMVYHAC